MILTVLLTILKVIGWILLILLGLILLILLLVLFCPLKYRIKGQLHRQIRESQADASGSWLFGAVGGGALLVNLKPQIYIRILKFRRFLGSDPETSEEEDERSEEELMEELFGEEEDPETSGSRKTSDENEGAGQKLFGSDEKEAELLPGETEQGTKEAGLEGKEPDTAEQEQKEADPEHKKPDEAKGRHKRLQKPVKKRKNKDPDPETPEADGKGADPAGQTKKKFTRADLESILQKLLEKAGIAAEKLDALMEKLEMLLETAERKIDGFDEKLDELGQKLEKILPIVEDEGNQQALLHVLRALWSIVKSILPYRLDADLTFSAGSPDTTGMILGVLAVLPVSRSRTFSVVPDFETESFYAEGDLTIFGKICIHKIVGALIGLLLDKNIRKVIKLILHMRKEKSV